MDRVRTGEQVSQTSCIFVAFDSYYRRLPGMAGRVRESARWFGDGVKGAEEV